MHVSTTVSIAAPRARVWEVLSRFDDYQRWHPMCRDMHGRCATGERIRFRLEVGAMRVPIVAQVVAAIPDRELRWAGPISALARRFAGGEHYFILHDEGTGTRVEHGEVFTGALAVGSLLGAARRLAPRYEAVNRALRAEAEAS
jgi:hypothetical protein